MDEVASQKYDLILAFNVLEHVPAAHNFLKSIKSNLADNGFAVLSVPDCERFLDRGDINGFLHEHLTYFSTASLRAMFASVGLKIVKITSNRDLFSVIVTHGSVQRDALDQLDERHRITKFHVRVSRLLNEMPRMIKRRVLAGEKVGLHGATHGLNTLLHIGGLESTPIFIFDGDMAKTGQYLPASNSKIRSLNDPLYNQMDVMIISALSFEQEIKADIAARTGLSADNVLPMLGETTS